ncbi:hypothetical protein GCK72_002300 [Caenorhabditis remanei]|uniref:Major sperm protein n=1 Tax=Caenorhabditis remanei TaxID=31234 RepID=A0A6A5HTM9_CAERE|nr:hypothetical protein GCK72_002300 [Caenorhabditis remanei]KAF1770481.1 hypothetical protein GCK72_002300 [Caenorhabditis remanei]
MGAGISVFVGITTTFWLIVGCGGKKKKGGAAKVRNISKYSPPPPPPNVESKMKALEEKEKKSEKKEEAKKEEEKKEKSKKSEKKEEKRKIRERRGGKEGNYKKENRREKEEEEETKRAEEEDDERKKKEGGSEAGELKPHSITHIRFTVDPIGDLEFQADKQEQKKITISNSHDKKIMFKLKTSDNNVYLVNPVFGTIEPGKTAEVLITRNKAPAKEAKLVIVNSLFSGDDKDLAKSFKTAKPTGGQVTVKLCAK